LGGGVVDLKGKYIPISIMVVILSMAGIYDSEYERLMEEISISNTQTGITIGNKRTSKCACNFIFQN